MIAAWMLYCVAIAVLFVVVGEALERALHLAGRATRWAWVAALVASYVVPAAAWLRPSAFGALPVPLAQPVVTGLAATGAPSDPPQVGGGLPAAPQYSLGALAATPAYGELLLRVGQRRARLPLGAPALGEPVSFLGRRIRRMVTALPRWRWAGATAAGIVAAAAIIAACEAPRPVGPQASSDRSAVVETERGPYSPGASYLRVLAHEYHPEVFAHPLPARLSGRSIRGIAWGSVTQPSPLCWIRAVAWSVMPPGFGRPAMTAVSAWWTGWSQRFAPATGTRAGARTRATRAGAGAGAGAGRLSIGSYWSKCRAPTMRSASRWWTS